jgi:hypothetical protein
MQPNKNYLEEIINTFIVQRKRARFSELISSPRRYQDFLDEFFIDQRNLDPSCIQRLPKKVASVAAITEHLRETWRAKQIYVLSEDLDIDGSVASLETIGQTEIGRNVGILLYCIGNGSAYFEDSETTRLFLRAKPLP